jgi:hypothetical protein
MELAGESVDMSYHELSWKLDEIFRTSIEITPDATQIYKFTY